MSIEASASDLADAEVLVLAPHFPAINQPWIDTYLEQLLVNGIPFAVVSHVSRPTAYHAKVDKLGLRHRVIVCPPDKLGSFLLWLRSAHKDPVAALGRLWRMLQRQVKSEALAQRLYAAVRASNALFITDKITRLECVHAHSLDLGFEFIGLAEERGLRLVTTFHGLKPNGVPQTPEARRRRVFQASERVIVNTVFARGQAIELGCESERLAVLPQGLPLEDFPFAADKKPTVESGLQLLSVGRLDRDKGQHYSLLALRRLLNNGIRAHWHFAGTGPDLEKLWRLAVRLKLEQSVTFHEALGVSALGALYRECHLLVLASLGSSTRTGWVETQGVVLQEAQASGCIPIATAVGGIPECVRDGVDGLLIDDRSHRAIVDGIERMLSVEQDWPAFRRRGRDWVETAFSAEAVGKRMAAQLRGG